MSIGLEGRFGRPAARKILRAGLLASSALIAASTLPAKAQDATWGTTPPGNDINDGANWSTSAVPTGIATFGQSTQTSLILGGAVVTLSFDRFVFDSGAPAYTFTPGFNGITFTGLGIVNSSSSAPTFNVIGGLTFSGGSSAANANINASAGAVVEFNGTSTAANAVITNDASYVRFVGRGDGGNAQLIAGASSAFDFSGSAGVNNDNIVHAGSIEGGTTGFFILGNQRLSVGSNNRSTEVMGVINDFGAGGSIEKVGTGTLTLSGVNTYTGGTRITAGTLAITNADAVGSGTVRINGGTLSAAPVVPGTINFINTINVSGNGGITAATGSILSLDGDLNIAAASTTTFGSTTDRGTVSFNLAGGGGSPGTANIIVAGGTLADANGSLGVLLGSTASTTVNSGATIDLTNSFAPAIRNLKGSGTVATGPDPIPGFAALGLLVDPGTTSEFSGTISGTGSVQIYTGGATGRMILSGNNTYGGDTYICDCAELQVGNGGLSGNVNGTVFNAGTLIFNRADPTSAPFVVGNLISDDPALPGFFGQVVQNGTGTTALTADNTYTGGTTVNAGMLVIGNGGTTGSIVGNVVVNAGAFGVNRSDIYTLPNTISGNGGFAQLGTGTTIFNTAQTYLGTTTISAGTLQIEDGGSIASTAIVDNATLAINRSTGFTLNATVSGSGGLNQLSGTTTLDAATTYSGTTNITAGVLRAGAANVFSSSSAFNVGASGALNLSGFSQSIGSLSGSGAVTLAAATLTTGGDNTSTTYSGSIAGAGGLTKTGTGNFIYTGTSAYTGATTVNGGTLSINGSIATSSGVTVNAGGILGGTGTLPGTTINAGGALAPGNSIGTIAVNGNLTFNTGAAYNVEVSPSTSDRTNVTGIATLNGATVATNFSAGSYLVRQYTIANATGGVSGTFGSLVNTNLPVNFAANLSYDTNNAYLNLILQLSNLGAGLSTNQQNVGNSLINYFNANGGIPAVYGTLTQGGLTQASGEPGASVSTAGFAAMGQFIGAMMDGSGGDGGGAGGLGFADADAYAPNAYASKRKLTPQQSEAYSAVTPRDRMAAPFASRWNVWAAGYGGNSTIAGDASAGTHSTSTRVFGTVVGADYRATPDTRFGFAAGAGSANFAVDSGLGGGRADVFQLGAYARHTIGTAYLAGAVAYGWQDVTTDRTVTISGTDKLRAELKTNALSARLETGWRYAALPVAVTPYAAAQSTTFYLPSYGETATSGSNQFALSYGSKTVTATRGELGFRFDKAMLVRDGVFTLKAKSAWAHDWNTDRSATATFQSLPGATFIVNGAQPSANAALLSLGGEMGWHNGWTLAANFDGEFSRTTQGYAGRGTLKYAW